MADSDNAVYVMMEKITKAAQTIIALVVVLASFLLFYALLFKDINIEKVKSLSVKNVGMKKILILMLHKIYLYEIPYLNCLLDSGA